MAQASNNAAAESAADALARTLQELGELTDSTGDGVAVIDGAAMAEDGAGEFGSAAVPESREHRMITDNGWTPWSAAALEAMATFEPTTDLSHMNRLGPTSPLAYKSTKGRRSPIDALDVAMASAVVRDQLDTELATMSAVDRSLGDAHPLINPGIRGASGALLAVRLWGNAWQWREGGVHWKWSDDTRANYLGPLRDYDPPPPGTPAPTHFASALGVCVLVDSAYVVALRSPETVRLGAIAAGVRAMGGRASYPTDDDPGDPDQIRWWWVAEWGVMPAGFGGHGPWDVLAIVDAELTRAGYPTVLATNASNFFGHLGGVLALVIEWGFGCISSVFGGEGTCEFGPLGGDYIELDRLGSLKDLGDVLDDVIEGAGDTDTGSNPDGTDTGSNLDGANQGDEVAGGSAGVVLLALAAAAVVWSS